MIQFLYPEFFLLAIPLGWLFFQYIWTPGTTGVLRLVILLLMLLALTGPEINIGGRGLDLIVVVDRSDSMQPVAQQNVQELIENLENNRGQGDRIGLVTFGSEAEVESHLSSERTTGSFTKPIHPGGSNLYDALLKSLQLVDPTRPARILVLSDGESNGASPQSAARRAREAGVPIDYRIYERERLGDIAVESVLLPETVSPREPFQYSVWIYADQQKEGTLKVHRDSREIVSKEVTFQSGMNRYVFRDLLESAGIHHYDVHLELEDDPLAENNHGAGLVRVDAGPRVLVLNQEGASDTNLVRALKAARIPTDVAKAKSHDVTQDALDPYRAVIIENVPASHFGRLKMERLAQFVEDLGGGLLLTGGESSFGSGGYFRSPLDATLPVSMEIREEHRKHRLAMCIALDRSGSMAMPVKGSKTKMDLANLGTVECVRLLGPSDMISVIAVDTIPHVVQNLVNVDNSEHIISKVKRIESMGGGIFVHTALVSAGKELMKAKDFNTRHIILFSDASDSEEPGKYKDLLKKFTAVGITVSVIGLGTKSDIDAKLLEDIAKLGNGNIMFTTDPHELPRLFTEDTMSVARSSFIKADTDLTPEGFSGRMLPSARLMGEFQGTSFPHTLGYNLCYLKPEATLGVVSEDDYQAPWSAFWYRGLGRVSAVTLEVDGKFSGEFARWSDYEDFLITHTRWLLGGSNPNDVFVNLERTGQDALITVELDPRRPNQSANAPPELLVVPPGEEREDVIVPDFVWTGPHTLEARVRLDRVGSYRTLVKTGPQEFTRGPALTLPYSPEHIPRVGMEEGTDILDSLAEISGGEKRTDVLTVFDQPPRSAKTVPLLIPLMIASILLLLMEIAGRRLSLWAALTRKLRRTPALATASGSSMVDSKEMPAEKKASWMPNWRALFQKKPKAKSIDESRTTSSPSEKSKESASTQERTGEQEKKTSSADAFKKAKSRAKRRLNDSEPV